MSGTLTPSGCIPGMRSNPGSAASLPAAAVGKQYLRGTQFTDAQGNVQFRTIFPSWYGGRTPHVHFKVFLGGKEVVASQIFFPDEITQGSLRASGSPIASTRPSDRTFNDNDPIRQGVYSTVARQRGAYAATAVLVVASR